MNQEKLIREALIHPHPGNERFDQDFVMAFNCPNCGKMGAAPRKFVRDAIAEHRQSCPALKQEQSVFRVYYPRS